MSNSMQHMNGDQLCVIQIVPTGDTPDWHEIQQLCILPLTSIYLPRKDVLPFYVTIKPNFPERIEAKGKPARLKMAELALKGFDSAQAIDLFYGWFDKLDLKCNKYGNQRKLVPLGYEYHTTKEYLINWLGQSVYDIYFYPEFRDIRTTAAYLNDRAAEFAETIPFPKTNLRYIASSLKLDLTGAKDLLLESLWVSRIYKKMVSQGLLF